MISQQKICGLTWYNFKNFPAPNHMPFYENLITVEAESWPSRDFQKKVIECVQQLFSTTVTGEKTTPQQKTKNRHRQIYKALELLPKRFKTADAFPNEFDQSSNPSRLLAAIDHAVTNKQPIPIGLVIGTLRNPLATDPESEKRGELLDALFVHRLLHIDDVIRKIYENGTTMTIMADDAVSHGLFDHASSYQAVEEAQTNFLNNLATIMTCMEGIYISSGIENLTDKNTLLRMKRESDIYKECSIQFDRYMELCAEYELLFCQYFSESDGIYSVLSENELSQLPSSKKLAEVGWGKPILPEMTQFYADRIKNSQPDITDDEILKQLARYFATSCAKNKHKALQQAVGIEQFVRAGFVPLAPGSPTAYQNTILLSAHPRIGSNTKTTPPWRSSSFIEVSGRGAQFATYSPRKTVSELKGVERVWPATLYIDGKGILNFNVGEIN